MCVPGMKLRILALAAKAFTLWAISPAHLPILKVLEVDTPAFCCFLIYHHSYSLCVKVPVVSHNLSTNDILGPLILCCGENAAHNDLSSSPPGLSLSTRCCINPLLIVTRKCVPNDFFNSVSQLSVTNSSLAGTCRKNGSIGSLTHHASTYLNGLWKDSLPSSFLSSLLPSLPSSLLPFFSPCLLPSLLPFLSLFFLFLPPSLVLLCFQAWGVDPKSRQLSICLDTGFLEGAWAGTKVRPLFSAYPLH